MFPTPLHPWALLPSPCRQVTQAVGARARGTPVTPPLAEGQKHWRTLLLNRSGCIFCVAGCGRDEGHRKREKSELMMLRHWCS